ncbi:unnamed protein product, partial [Ectocarpus fasciculatus]
LPFVHRECDLHNRRANAVPAHSSSSSGRLKAAEHRAIEYLTSYCHTAVFYHAPRAAPLQGKSPAFGTPSVSGAHTTNAGTTAVIRLSAHLWWKMVMWRAFSASR